MFWWDTWLYCAHMGSLTTCAAPVMRSDKKIIQRYARLGHRDSGCWAGGVGRPVCLHRSTGVPGATWEAFILRHREGTHAAAGAVKCSMSLGGLEVGWARLLRYPKPLGLRRPKHCKKNGLGIGQHHHGPGQDLNVNASCQVPKMSSSGVKHQRTGKRQSI